MRIKGHQFEKARKAIGWSRRTMSDRVGVTYGTVKLWEYRKPDEPVPQYAQNILKTIAEEEGVDLEFIILGP